MMGPRQEAQGGLFHELPIEAHVPAAPLLRRIDRFVDLSGIRRLLAPFHRAMGRPSVDPELMIGMLIVGSCFGIRSERRLCDGEARRATGSSGRFSDSLPSLASVAIEWRRIRTVGTSIISRADHDLSEGARMADVTIGGTEEQTASPVATARADCGVCELSAGSSAEAGQPAHLARRTEVSGCSTGSATDGQPVAAKDEVSVPEAFEPTSKPRTRPMHEGTRPSGGGQQTEPIVIRAVGDTIENDSAEVMAAASTPAIPAPENRAVPQVQIAELIKAAHALEEQDARASLSAWLEVLDILSAEPSRARERLHAAIQAGFLARLVSSDKKLPPRWAHRVQASLDVFRRAWAEDCAALSLTLQLERSALFRLLDLARSDTALLRQLCAVIPIDPEDSELAGKVAGLLGVPPDATGNCSFGDGHRLSESAHRAQIEESILPAFRNGRAGDLFAALKRSLCDYLDANGVWPGRDAVLDALFTGGRIAPRTEDVPAAPRHAERERLLLGRPDHLRVVEHLLIASPQVLLDGIEAGDRARLAAAVRAMEQHIPVYAIVTDVSYPMGGGESYMHQTARQAAEMGYRVVWFSFVDRRGEPHAGPAKIPTPFYEDCRVAGGLSEDTLAACLSSRRIDVVHTQGGANDPVMAVAERIRIPVIAGYHFWDGLVTLDPRTRNRRIRAHIAGHALTDESRAGLSNPFLTRYVASEFMLEVYRDLGGNGKLEVIHPLSDPSQFLVRNLPPAAGRPYVLQVNTVPGKGGRILLECLRTLGHAVPFMAINAEPDESGVSDRIAQLLARHDHHRLSGYTDIREALAGARLVLVPSTVDETFCRIAYEAAMNGIPVLSTGAGFLPSLLGEECRFLPEDPAVWTAEIARLHADPAACDALGRRQKAEVERRFAAGRHGFVRLLVAKTRQSPLRNIGLFGPWADQGLGNQLRHYAALLRRFGFGTHVFSFLPYAAIGRADRWQHDPADWSVPERADSVHYSLNTRENVTRAEIEQFCKMHSVGLLLYPEICWARNWDTLRSVSLPNLFVLGVPNVETMRRAEVNAHSALFRTFANTRSVEEILLAHGVRNVRYVGHGFGDALDATRLAAREAAVAAPPRLRFLHVAGYNPGTRKNTALVIEAFMRVLAERDDVHLTVAVKEEGLSQLALPDGLPDGIEIIPRSLSHDEVLDLYDRAHVSVQVSTHEGLGLGFYESIARGVPVVSLDATPHNEIVQPDMTGWLVPAQRRPLPDNDDPVSTAWQTSADALAETIRGIDAPAVSRLLPRLAAEYNARWTEHHLAARLVANLL